MAEILQSFNASTKQVVAVERVETQKVASSASIIQPNQSSLKYDLVPQKQLPDSGMQWNADIAKSANSSVFASSSSLNSFLHGTNNSEFNPDGMLYIDVEPNKDLTPDAKRYLRNGGNFDWIINETNDICNAKASGNNIITTGGLDGEIAWDSTDESLPQKITDLLNRIDLIDGTIELKRRLRAFVNNMINRPTMGSNTPRSGLSNPTNTTSSSVRGSGLGTSGIINGSNRGGSVATIGSGSGFNGSTATIGSNVTTGMQRTESKVMSLQQQGQLASYAPFAVPGEYFPPMLVTDTLDAKASDFSAEGLKGRDGFVFLNVGDFKLEDGTYPRNVPVLKVPDADIDAVQDLGFGSGTIRLSGRFWAQAGMMRLESLRNLCMSRRPLIFISQETGAWSVFPLNVPGVSTVAGQPYQYYFDLNLACVGKINEKRAPGIYDSLRKFVEAKLNREKAILDAWISFEEIKNFEDIGVKGDINNPRRTPGYYFDPTVIANQRDYGFAYDTSSAQIDPGNDLGVMTSSKDGTVPGTTENENGQRPSDLSPSNRSTSPIPQMERNARGEISSINGRPISQASDSELRTTRDRLRADERNNNNAAAKARENASQYPIGSKIRNDLEGGANRWSASAQRANVGASQIDGVLQTRR